MEGVGVDIGRQPPGAADAGDHRKLVLVEAEIMDRPQQGPQRDAMPATGAEEVRHHLLAEIVGDVEIGGGVDEHHAPLASAVARVAARALMPMATMTTSASSQCSASNESIRSR